MHIWKDSYTVIRVDNNTTSSFGGSNTEKLEFRESSWLFGVAIISRDSMCFKVVWSQAVLVAVTTLSFGSSIGSDDMVWKQSRARFSSDWKLSV